MLLVTIEKFFLGLEYSFIVCLFEMSSACKVAHGLHLVGGSKIRLFKASGIKNGFSLRFLSHNYATTNSLWIYLSIRKLIQI